MNYQEVAYNPQNNSSTKHLYSFHKGQRFQKDPIPSCKQAAYDHPSSFNKRTTSLGYGKKQPFPKPIDSPGPCRYNLNTNNRKGRGFSMGAGSKTSLVDKQQVEIPGPGSYKPLTNRYKNVSYSMGNPKQQLRTMLIKKLGPGHYDQPGTFSKTGQNPITKFKNSMATKISSSRRFNWEQIVTPGPGLYGNPKIETMSKYKKTGGRTFARAKRQGLIDDKKIPGPGSQYNIQQQNLHVVRHKILT